MPVATARASLLPLASLGLLACSSGTTLMGSMQEFTPLAFTKVEFHLQGAALSLSYDDFVDGGANIPFTLTVDTTGVPLDAGHSFELDGGTDAGTPIAIASRSVVMDTRPFSAISFGHLTLDGPVAVGSSVSGDFFVVFQYQNDGSLGSGHTVYGNFSAKVAP